MADRDVLAGKLDAIRSHIDRVRRSGALDASRFLDDQVVQDAALFNLVQATQSAVDVGAVLIALRGWETPVSLGHTFAVLQERGVVTKDLATHLAELAGLRNLLMHRYGKVDLTRVHRDLARDLDVLDRFASSVSSLPETST